MRAIAALTLTTLFALPAAEAAEICGNNVDDDGDGLTDDGCYTLAADQCESPLSCNETGMVAPLSGGLYHRLPPDVAPKVPYGPGIGFRRTYLSQYTPGATTPPTYQAMGTAVDGDGAVTPPWPAHAVNDVALLIVESAGTQAVTLSSPQGFALIGSRADSTDINGTRLTVFWKRATSTAEPAPTIADPGDHVLARILTFRNVAPTGNPWDVTAGSATSGTGNLYFSVPGATTSEANTLVVAITANSGTATAAGWSNLTPLGGAIERTDISTTFGNDGAFAVLTGSKLTAGPFLASTGSLSVSNRQASMSLALRSVDNAAHWKKPMGDRWQHTYLTWVNRTGTAPSSSLVVHTPQGQDVRAPYSSSSGGWDYYTPQAGYRVQHIRHRQAAPSDYQIRLLTGETLVYNSSGRLIEIADTLATPNKVTLAYYGTSELATVTAASGKRRLVFGYTANRLTSVAFQVQVSGVFTTYNTVTYAYASDLLSTVTIGGQLAQTNVYTGAQLTQVQDGGGKNLLSVAYNASAGSVARLSVPSGTLGYDYNSTRAACSGKTVLYFNLGNATTCNVDGDCGSGFLCGGKTGAGATGRCFRGARCLTVSSPSEDVITSVTALGPPSEACEGACLQASTYIWNTGSGVLDLAAVQDPAGNYTVHALNGNGLPTTITYGDADTDPNNTNSARKLFIGYDTNFPGRIAHTRRQSDQGPTGGACTATTGDCAVTTNTWNSDGKLSQVVETGFTRTGTDGITAFSYTTTFTYDAKGRPKQVDGPLAGSNDVTQFTYYAPTGTFADDFLDEYRRKKDATTFLTQRAMGYDFWGNPVILRDVDQTYTCLVFSSARGFLEKRTENMVTHTDCSTNAANLVTTWVRDSALRLTQLIRPDGGCLFYEYDANGRLQRSKRRDDCNATSAGDRQDFVYDTEGLLAEIQTYDASGTMTSKQPFTYFDSRHLHRVVNPVDTSKWTGIIYDPRGLVSQVDAAGGLGRTVFNRAGTAGADGRVTSVERYKTSSTFDTWNLLYAWLGEQTKVTDGDLKPTETVRDDLGRVVKLISTDMAGPTLHLYDEASRLLAVVEAYGATGQATHIHTFDNLGRPLTSDFQGGCDGTTNPPEILRAYDALPSGVTCPLSGGCNRLGGRVAYEKVRLVCSSALGGDNSLDQETFYSYDDAGRVIAEYIRDDSGRVAEQAYTWTKNGSLSQVALPSGVTLQWTYGTTGNNSDSDLVTAQSRLGTGNPVTTEVAWFPYGPLKSYKHEATYGGVKTRTRIERNLAYRVTAMFHETSTGATTLQSLTTAEDAKGRITKRDYLTGGVTDSYFLYDDQDRLLCETTTLVSSCPSSGTNIKNSHTASPPFTNAGDWKLLMRPIPGAATLAHEYTIASANHRITSINQVSSGLRSTNFGYNALGSRTSDNNAVLSNDDRTHTYDQRRNKVTTTGWVRQGSTWHLYTAASQFDARNRRVAKSYTANGVTSSWFFYYDPFDRLTEVRYTPNTASASTYQVFQLLWVGGRMTATHQTDLPSASVQRSYVVTDETNRPIELWWRPASGDTTRAWAIDPRAWGLDVTIAGANVFQPLVFAGQYRDSETTAYQDDGVTEHRHALIHNGFRAYDPFVGGYLQTDRALASTWDAYIYAGSSPAMKIDPHGLEECLPGDCDTGGEGPGGGGGPNYCSAQCWLACKIGVGWACDCNKCFPSDPESPDNPGGGGNNIGGVGVGGGGGLRPGGKPTPERPFAVAPNVPKWDLETYGPRHPRRGPSCIELGQRVEEARKVCAAPTDRIIDCHCYSRKDKIWRSVGEMDDLSCVSMTSLEKGHICTQGQCVGLTTAEWAYNAARCETCAAKWFCP